MIGPWNNSGCELAILPNVWNNGERPTNYINGPFPVYDPQSKSYTTTLTNYQAGAGYMKGLVNYDGNGHIMTNYDLPWSNALNLTIALGFYYNSSGGQQTIVSQQEDASNSLRLASTAANALLLTVRIGGVSRFVGANNILLNGYNMVHFIKTGADMKFSYNGLPATSYGVKQNYDLGTKTMSEALSFSKNGSTLFRGAMYSIIIYEEALSDDRVKAEWDMGKNFRDLVGTSFGYDSPRLRVLSKRDVDGKTSSSSIQMGIM